MLILGSVSDCQPKSDVGTQEDSFFCMRLSINATSKICKVYYEKYLL